MWWYLFYTFLVEIPILYWFLRKQDHWLMIGLVGVLLSAFTWPLGMYAYHEWHWNIYLLELLIAGTESLFIKVYWQLTWARALLIGFSINGFSFMIGLLSH